MKPFILIIYFSLSIASTLSFSAPHEGGNKADKKATSILFKSFSAWKYNAPHTGHLNPKKTTSIETSPKHQNVFIIAHADDWQLFMGHHMHDMINSHDENIFIYLTAGDAGKDQNYWSAREGAAISSINHIIASELNVPVEENSQSEWVSVTDGNSIMRVTQYQHQHHYFMRLPDGFHWGQGSKFYDHTSIFKLWNESLEELTTVDNYSTYKKESLITAIHSIIETHQDHSPSSLTIHTLDAGTNLEVSHSDHYISSLVAHEVAKSFPYASGAIYIDYRIAQMKPNLTCEQLHKKTSLFKSYDDHMNKEAGENLLGRKKYRKWLQRTYKQERSTKNLIDYVGKPIQTQEI